MDRLRDVLERVTRGALAPDEAARLLRGMPPDAAERIVRPGAPSGTPHGASASVEALPPQAGLVEVGTRTDTRTGTAMPTDTGRVSIAEAGRDDAAREYVLQALADVFQMPRDRLRLDASFGSLGIDSRGFVELLKQLQTDLGPLPKTLLFEYPTAARLAAHLAERHGAALARCTGAAVALATEEPSSAQASPVASEKSAASAAPVASGDLAPRAEDLKRAGPMRVAIVGLVGRFPMADDLDAFWANLAAGRNCVVEVPPDRWDAAAHFDPDPGAPGKACGKWGGFLTRVDTFDYRYFGISPREAAYMAPEERLMLETTSTLFEQAGYTRRRLADEQRQGAGVGVFVGCMHQHYRDLAERPEDAALLSTTSYWGIANRLSYTFDLRGPSLAIDTACASALTAVHAACESLRRGECRMAIAGAVNLSLHPAKYVSLSQIGMLSTGAESRGLGMADGLVPGEGVGALLLKPLAAALADGDPIQAVILGSAASHGGAAGSYTAVNPEALARVIETAVRAAAIDPRTINYLELAANGSPMGDALELTATNAALARLGIAGSCAVGTVKSNIGHLEAASGLSQIAKVVLQMTHGQLAPSIHCDPANPDLPLRDSPCRIQRELSAWEPVTLDGRRTPRRAGITSVGAGGSYAHLVLEERASPLAVPDPGAATGSGTGTATTTAMTATTAATPTAAAAAAGAATEGTPGAVARRGGEEADTPQLLTLSAKTAERLGVMAARLAAWLREHQQVRLCDVAFTLQARRDAFDERLAIVASTVQDAWQQLERTSGAAVSKANGREGTTARGAARSSSAVDTPGTPGPATLRQQLARGRWHELARSWMAGAEPPWEEIHQHGSRRVLPLPAYPFEPTRAWITDRRDAAPPVAAPATAPATTAPTTGASETHTRLFEPTRARVAELASAVLGVPADDLGDGQGFVQHGMTSVGAVHLVRSINRAFGLTLKTTALFECATVPDLARLIVERSPVAAVPPVEPRVPKAPSTPNALNGATHAMSPSASDVMVASEASDAPDLQHHYAVTVAEPQLLSDLRLRRIEPRDPDKGEVQIEVRAFALNFGDLLCVQGLYPTMPDYPFTPGFEVSGVVSRIGEAVTRVGVGDEVMALTGAGLGGHATVATVPEWLVVRKPAGVPHEEAAAFPVAYLTMRHAFDIAQVQPGERVLIQTAAGGLGLIAVQMARQIGAEVIATAGSPRKMEYLRARGVAHIINYREEDFAARTRELVGPRGVDVVFNTLAGDAIQKGLELLAPGGRYVEIAMTGLQTRGRVDLSCLSSNQSLHCVDMRRLGGSRPDLLRTYLERMAAALAEGEVRATLDRLFDLSQVRDAYAHIADAQNIGKVVVSVPPRVAAGVPARERTIVPAARSRRDEREPIAVIGMSGRFPGADDVDAFWQMLRAGESAIRDVPPDRWDWRTFYRAERGTRGGIYTRQGGFLTDIDRFDAHFFRMSGREAAFTDPQQRLFLEECWKALDDAGMARLATRGARAGVFAGAASGDYQLRLAAVDPEPQAFWGNSASLIPARINYFLNLTGPSVSVDTACSSSLVAVHLACQALRSGECDVALAGGVYVGTTPGLFLAGCSASMLSPDGRCKAFDDAADGFVAGEGVAAIVLKPLSAAERDRDQIHAVLLATGTNQDGRTYGITVPSARAQAELESSVYEQASVDARSIGMVEAHGTGTRLGDPVEVDALTDAFRRTTADRQFCALGSVKTNIGHAAAAAGIAGLIKAVLALKHGEIPASLHFDRPNAQTPFESTPFFVNTALRPWRREQGPRRAAVSSFGFSGTNAHVLLEEYRPPAAGPDVDRPTLVPLSARDEGALLAMAGRLAAYLRRGERRLSDVAWTLQRGREAMDERLALVARSTDDLAAQLERAASGEVSATASCARGRATRELAEGVRAAADAEVHALLQQDAAGAGTLERLAALWVRGAAIDWTMLPSPADARTVSLPAYPFARERHWIDAPGAASAIVPVAAPVAAPAAAPVVTLAVTAVTSPVVTPAGDAERPLVTLRTVWRTSTLPRSRAAADNAAPPFVLIDGRRGGDARDPLDALASAPDARAAIVIWPEALDSGRLEAEPFSDAIARGMGLAARVLQAVAARGVDRAFRLIFAARESGGLVDPFVEAVSAFVPSLRQVMPRLAATFVSADAGAAPGLAADDAAMRTLIACATAELLASDRADRVRYGSGARFVAGLERMVSQSDADQQGGCPLKTNGVYVISGGLGRLGRQLGRHLATTYDARVMLLGRPRSGGSRAGEIASLREAGTELATVAADVTRADDVAAALDAVRRRHGRIDGVFHLAGCAGSMPLMEKSAAEIEATVAAKMAGAMHLDRLTRSDALDFFALFSSTSAWLGDFGRGDYAASNRFLDAYAAVREAARREGRCQGRTVSLGWSMWRDGGMHGDADAAELFMKTSGFRYIELGEGLFALERLLARGEAHALIVSATPARIDALVAPPVTNEDASVDAIGDAIGDARSSATLHTRDTRPAAGVASTPGAIASDTVAAVAQDDGAVLRAALEEDLRTVVGTLLQLDASRLDLDDNLGNFGFDSLTLAELADELSGRYAIELSPQLFYSATTLRRVAGHLLEKQPEEVRSRLRPQPASTPVSAAAPVAEPRPQVDAPPAETLPTTPSERVAVIGMAGLLPGSRGVREFWRHLEAGDDLITQREGQWGGFIHDVDRFDAAFFSISPREAELMDPQQRLLLQVVQSLFEDAGCPVASVAGRRVGVFVGVEQSDYAQRLWRAGLSHEAHATVGTHPAFMPNRVSHVFDLRGPSEVINAGCASGTLAIHRAIASLARGECEMAVVAATNLLLSTDGYDVVSRFNTLTPSGIVQAFAKGAAGSARGEGVCAVLLAPLDEASAAGRRVHAVIAGAAATHGGRGQSVAAPNPAAQAESIRLACARAGVEPRSLGYLETQATGSELGDAIELGGYQEAFGPPSAGEPRCALGALKPTCGHLEAASGIAALMKVSLALQHRRIPAVKHADRGEPLAPIAESGFFLPPRSVPWEAKRDAAGQPLPRRAGIQSYGLGGVYVHLVVEEAPTSRVDTTAASAPPDGVPQLIVLSARDEERLAERVSNLLAFLDDASEGMRGAAASEPADSLADIAFTLQVGRDGMRARLALLARSRDELRARLAAVLRGDADTSGIYRSAGAVLPGAARPAPPAARTSPMTPPPSADLHDDARIAEAVRARDLGALAALWVAGASVPWSDLHAAHRPRIVSLPTYPFARDRHWVDDAPPPAPAAAPVTAATGARVQISPPSASSSASAAEPPTTSNGHSPSSSRPDQAVDDQATLAWLRDVVAERLKVESSRLAVDTPFPQYGLDSLLSTQVMQLIQMRYGRTIPYAAMTEHPTLLRLAAHLDAVSASNGSEQRPRAASMGSGALSASTSTSSSTSTFPRGRAGRHAAEDAMASLLLINPTGRHAPSFWVHGAPGTGELYNHLSAALGPEYPIHAFQARGIDGVSLPFTTLPEMAAHYVDAMLAVQPTGPYFIGGYSSGGLIAYEIAQQLTLRGLDVGHLILLDTYPPEMLKSFGRTRSRRKRHLQRVMGAILFFAAENRIDIWDRLSVEDLKAIPDTAPIAHLARLVKQRLPTPLPEDHVFRVLSGVDTILALNDEMGRGYELRPYAGSDVLFFKTRELIDPKSPYGIPGLDIADLGFKKDTFARIADFPYLDMWRALIARRVDVVPCACDHLSLFDEPHVDIVRQKLASAFAPYTLHATHGKVVTP